LGLVLFLGIHSVRIFANDWRDAQVARMGELRWRGVYALFAIAGLALIIWGYGLARADPVVLWLPPAWTRHLAALLTVPAFILLVAAYLPGSHIKAKIGHPMVAGVKVWALAHLPANGNLADATLFGAFLVWAIADFVAARRRDRIAGRTYPVCCWTRDAAVVVIGLLAWVLFALWGHVWLIGVKPFGV
ncbi:MAG: NnrU family protein, partial [Rhodocyclaceae bacterium]|nr:NnrU family protein [Rhodocyclaceae bacterium]